MEGKTILRIVYDYKGGETGITWEDAEEEMRRLCPGASVRLVEEVRRHNLFGRIWYVPHYLVVEDA